MGTFSAWSYTATCTVWSVTTDEYDQPSFGAPVVHACSYKGGGSLSVDDVGQQFTPKTTIWLETADDTPQVGDYVLIGTSQAATPPANAEVIRVAMAHDPTLFDQGTPDRVLLTG